MKTFHRFTTAENLQELGLEKPAYFYHCGLTPKGRFEIMGPESEIEAEEFAQQLTDGEVFELNTRDRAKATSMIKAELLKRGADHDKALARATHQHNVPNAVRSRARGLS